MAAYNVPPSNPSSTFDLLFVFKLRQYLPEHLITFLTLAVDHIANSEEETVTKSSMIFNVWDPQDDQVYENLVVRFQDESHPWDF